jgi:alkylation response protein AidB-like acyl-CoA dehydrogenase
MTTLSLAEYRAAARKWVTANLQRIEGDDPDMVSDPSEERIVEAKRIQAKLYEAGYAGFTFPTEYGGQGLTLEHERIFLEEATGYDHPNKLFGVSINILGATLAAFGTHEQKSRHLSRILSGEEMWLQLLSEPSGGSDLAGLLTSATRDGEHYVVSGQKIWSTGAHFADFALCPVRTSWDVPKHRGLSLLIVDLRAPGVEIRRIKQVNGEAHFCEEFLTDMLVPVSNRVGDENEGWRVIRGLLEIEHAWVGRGGAKRADARRDVSDLVELATRRGRAADLDVRRRVAAVHVDVQVQKLVSVRVSKGIESGQLDPSYGSMLKIGNDHVIQSGSELALALAGSNGITWDPDDPATGEWSHQFLTSRSVSIAGGTAEILRNNVSEKVLGLPREPSFDRDVPFNQVPHN